MAATNTNDFDRTPILNDRERKVAEEIVAILPTLNEFNLGRIYGMVENLAANNTTAKQ